MKYTAILVCAILTATAFAGHSGKKRPGSKKPKANAVVVTGTPRPVVPQATPKPPGTPVPVVKTPIGLCP